MSEKRKKFPVVDTRMRDIPLMRRPEDSYLKHHFRTPWGFLNMPYRDWRKHVLWSRNRSVPWSATPKERYAASKDKTQNLIDLMGGALKPSEKLKLMLGATHHQGEQGYENIERTGLLGSWPNWVDWKANIATIWDAPSEYILYKKKQKN